EVALAHVDAALRAAAWIAVIGGAVAVVVLAVTDLARGRDAADATPALRAVAAEPSGLARRRERAEAGAGRARDRIPLRHGTGCRAVAARRAGDVPATVRAVRGCVGELAGRRARVVDEAVAVVVDAVAHLRRRLPGGLADERPGDALRQAGG